MWMPLTGAPLREEESFVLGLGLRVILVWSSLDCGSSRFDPKRGQRDVAGEVSEPDSEGTLFESSGWSLSSPLRGSFENASSMSDWTRVWRNRVTPCAVTLLAWVPSG